MVVRLGVSQTNAWSVLHCFFHVLNQSLDFVARYFFARQRTRRLPQNRFSCLHDLQTQLVLFQL